MRICQDYSIIHQEQNGDDFQEDMPSQLNSMYFKPSYPDASLLPPGQRMDTTDDMFGEVTHPETIEVFESPGDRLEASGCNINDVQVRTMYNIIQLNYYVLITYLHTVLIKQQILIINRHL